MKKYFLSGLVLCFVLFCMSCTEQARTKSFGGNMTINLPVGQKLMNATWKDNNLWYLVRPMREDELPESYYLIEDSSFDVWEGSITFHESK